MMTTTWKHEVTSCVDVPTLWLLLSALNGSNLSKRRYQNSEKLNVLGQLRLTISRSKENMRKFLARFPNGIGDFKDDTNL